MTSEWTRIALLRAIFDETDQVIGDDCAVIAPSAVGSSSLVWSIDASVQHVHFERAWMSLEDIGWRATMAAFSDLAAMGAEALGGLSALTLPRAFSDDELEQLARGQRAACDALGTSILGGNLARGEVLTITTTVLGKAGRPLTRNAAPPGANVFLAGAVGLSAAGLFDAQQTSRARGDALPREEGIAWERARAAFRRPEAQLAAGRLAAARGAFAAIDVSDGLASDLGHLAKESRVAVILDENVLAPLVEALPAHPSLDRREAVLFGGEDYALVAIAADLPSPFGRIGSVTSDQAPGVYLRASDGGLSPLRSAGFDHFR